MAGSSSSRIFFRSAKCSAPLDLPSAAPPSLPRRAGLPPPAPPRAARQAVVDGAGVKLSPPTGGGRRLSASETVSPADGGRGGVHRVQSPPTAVSGSISLSVSSAGRRIRPEASRSTPAPRCSASRPAGHRPPGPEQTDVIYAGTPSGSLLNGKRPQTPAAPSVGGKILRRGRQNIVGHALRAERQRAQPGPQHALNSRSPVK